VPLIAQSGSQLDLVISRRPTDIALSDSPPTSASVAAAPKQCHVVVDQAVAGQSLNRQHMREDDV